MCTYCMQRAAISCAKIADFPSRWKACSYCTKKIACNSCTWNHILIEKRNVALSFAAIDWYKSCLYFSGAECVCAYHSFSNQQMEIQPESPKVLCPSNQPVWQSAQERASIIICLARSAHLPTGLYILHTLISSLFNMSKATSGSTGPIFIIFFTKWKLFAWIFLDSSQFSDSSRDVTMATNFVSYRTFSLTAEISQDLLDRFSQSLHHMVDTELQMTNPTFFQYFKATNFFVKITNPQHLSLWHFETEWDSATSICALTCLYIV